MEKSKLEEFATRMMEIPEEIQEKQNLLIDLNEQTLDQSESIKKIEADIKQNINSELDDNGKKKYPNAESRDAAFIEISGENTDLVDLRRENSLKQREIQELRNEIEMLSNKQRNIRSLLGIFSN